MDKDRWLLVLLAVGKIRARRMMAMAHDRDTPEGYYWAEEKREGRRTP